MENYTYRTRPELAQADTFVYLFCGEKEPFAKKSHEEVKPYLTYYEENIIPDAGHGEILLKDPEKLIDLMIEVFERDDACWHALQRKRK